MTILRLPGVDLNSARDEAGQFRQEPRLGQAFARRGSPGTMRIIKKTSVGLATSGEGQQKSLQDLPGHQRRSADASDEQPFAALACSGSRSAARDDASLCCSPVTGRLRSIFTRATRLPSISTTLN